MRVRVVWKGCKNVQLMYPRTRVIKRILAKWNVPPEAYEHITLVFEFCRIFYLSIGEVDGVAVYASETDGMYRGEKNGTHLIQLNSDLALYMQFWADLRKTGVHELRHLAWDLLDPNKKVGKDGFQRHTVTAEEECDCQAVEDSFPAVVWRRKNISYPTFKPRRNPRFSQLLLPNF